MNVLIVNTSEKTGGAAIAASRLLEALNDHGVKARMLVRDKQTDRLTVAALPRSLRRKWNFVWERAVLWMHNRFSMKHLWAVSLANTGTDITQTDEFQWADVIHLHWINQGFLSLHDLEKIVKSGKRIVWTLHDQWPYTGICHYAGDCTRYEEGCHHCPLLRSPGAGDLSFQVYEQKRSLYHLVNHITFVGCSQWMADLARKSALLRGVQSPTVNGNIPPCRVCHIPNAIDQTIYHPTDRMAARRALNLPADRKLLLFSSLKVTDKRKGIAYLIEACHYLERHHPEQNDKIGIVVVGKHTEAMQGMFPFPLYPLSYIADEHQMALLYTSVDAFITPSLQDNLPNTIVEAMSVGTPCVGFRTGGIPEMIHHRMDGYVAEPCNAQDLAEGILYVLDDGNHEALSRAAAQFAAQTYSPDRVARQYEAVYRNP